LIRVNILIPAHDEAGYLGNCLKALLAADTVTGAEIDVIVIANACTDDTVEIASNFMDRATAKGWNLQVIETPTPGKLNALNLGERARAGDILIYLDADVIISKPLIGELVAALSVSAPRYAGGTPLVIAPSHPLIARYARFWAKLPFVSKGVPGFGIFAVNAAGRARWGQFPEIISDDTFVRLQFRPAERVRVAATYRWPMVNGLGNLIRVRRRQDIGVAEIAERFPDLQQNDGGSKPTLAFLAGRILRDPLGFIAYGLVSVAVRLPIYKNQPRWARGR